MTATLSCHPLHKKQQKNNNDDEYDDKDHILSQKLKNGASRQLSGPSSRRSFRDVLIVVSVAVVLAEIVSDLSLQYRFYHNHLTISSLILSEDQNQDKQQLPQQQQTPSFSPSPQKQRQQRRYGDPNLTRPEFDHPRSGAKDEYGHWGYVHDPTILWSSSTNNNNDHDDSEAVSWEFRPSNETERDQICVPLIGEGPESDGTKKGNEFMNQLMSRHIQIASPTSAGADGSGPKFSSIKVFCAIYTYPGGTSQTDAVRMTWGKRCDGFMAASTETKHNSATVHIPHYSNYAPGQYKGIWQRVRSMIGYYYENFVNEYDFFFLCGDDTFLIMENLKALLTSPKFVEYAGGQDYPNPTYVGSWTYPVWIRNRYPNWFFYNGGGSGYVLNRAAIKALVEQVFPVCHNVTDDFAEDLYMGECLWKVLNVTGYDARDEVTGGERFIGLEPIRYKTKESVHQTYLKKQFERRRDHYRGVIAPEYGVESLSRYLVSVHELKTPAKMKRYEQLLYGTLPDCTLTSTNNTAV
jgi:glycoprotein-N-acetylgalactosamine 3-beta-galactosyltransferase